MGSYVLVQHKHLTLDNFLEIMKRILQKIPLRVDVWVSCTSFFEAHVSIMKTTLQCNAASFFLAAKKLGCFLKHYTFKTWLRDEKCWCFCVFTTSSQFQTRMSWAETNLFSQKCEPIVMLAQPVSVTRRGWVFPCRSEVRGWSYILESLYRHNLLLIHELAKQYNDKFLKCFYLQTNC